MTTLKAARRKKRSPSEKIVFSIAFLLFAIYAAYILFFFVFGTLIAIKLDMDAFTMDRIKTRLFSFPEHPNWKNFILAFGELGMIDNKSTFLSITWNSVWRTTCYAFLSIAASTMVCYVLVFYRTKLSKVIYNIGLFVAILPLYGSSGSMYRLLQNIHLINNPLIIIVDF